MTDETPKIEPVEALRKSIGMAVSGYEDGPAKDMAAGFMATGALLALCALRDDNLIGFVARIGGLMLAIRQYGAAVVAEGAVVHHVEVESPEQMQEIADAMKEKSKRGDLN